MLKLFEYSLKYHEGKIPVFKVDLSFPELVRPPYIKD